MTMTLRRPSPRLVLIVLLVVLFAIFCYELLYIYRIHTDVVEVGHLSSGSGQVKSSMDLDQTSSGLYSLEPSSNTGPPDKLADVGRDGFLDEAPPPRHRVLFSVSTREREYMRVYLGGPSGSNANLIPHPTHTDLWILVVQDAQPVSGSLSEQLICTAGIQNDAVLCTEVAAPVPLLTEANGSCTGEYQVIAPLTGSRDSRVFYGPDRPYILYGAKSSHICFGQWLQDARSIFSQFKLQRYMKVEPFQSAVELPRPTDSRPVEKNYFLFWDDQGTVYAHYTLWPKRAFSRLNYDGSGSPDVASTSIYHDQICMAKFMPLVKKSPLEAIHQATNSLLITTCERTDSYCIPSDANTFIMHIFQHKTYYDAHPVYEPYIILFQRSPPFAIHAVGQRPFWIHGRQNLTVASAAAQYVGREQDIPAGHTEMFYVTSISWRSHTQRYHGFIDDVLFISFGIEDARPGVIDVVADHLLQDLAHCGKHSD